MKASKLNYLIAATAKDLSMMICFWPRKEKDIEFSFSSVFLKSTNQIFDYKLILMLLLVARLPNIYHLLEAIIINAIPLQSQLLNFKLWRFMFIRLNHKWSFEVLVGGFCAGYGCKIGVVLVNAGTVVGVCRRWQSRRAVTVMFAAIDPLASQFLPSQSNVVSLVTCSPLQYQVDWRRRLLVSCQCRQVRETIRWCCSMMGSMAHSVTARDHITPREVIMDVYGFGIGRVVIFQPHKDTPLRGLAGDRRGVVPSSGFSFSAQQIWKVIKENRDLDLPAHKVMVATVRCEEIASDKLRFLTSDEVRSTTLDTWLPEQVAFIQYKRWVPKDNTTKSPARPLEDEASVQQQILGDRSGHHHGSNSENSSEERKKNFQKHRTRHNIPATTRISIHVPPKGPEPAVECSPAVYAPKGYFAIDIFNMLSMDRPSVNSSEAASADDNAWAGFQFQYGVAICYSPTANCFVAPAAVPSYALHQQQIAMLHQQQSLLMDAAAKSGGVMTNLVGNAQPPGANEAFHQLVARVDLNESEDQMVARYISGLSITIQDALAMQTLWTVSEAYNRALVAEKQEKRKFSRSGQQYQGGTKSGQPFYSYARGGSSSSGGQGVAISKLLCLIEGVPLEWWREGLPLWQVHGIGQTRPFSSKLDLVLREEALFGDLIPEGGRLVESADGCDQPTVAVSSVSHFSNMPIQAATELVSFLNMRLFSPDWHPSIYEDGCRKLTGTHMDVLLSILYCQCCCYEEETSDKIGNIHGLCFELLHHLLLHHALSSSLEEYLVEQILKVDNGVFVYNEQTLTLLAHVVICRAVLRHMIYYPHACPSSLLLVLRSKLRDAQIAGVCLLNTGNDHLSSWASVAVENLMPGWIRDGPISSNMLNQLIDIAPLPASVCRDEMVIGCLSLSWGDLCATFSQILGHWRGKIAETVDDLVIERYVFVLCWNVPTMGSTLEHLLHFWSGKHSMDTSNVEHLFCFSHSLLGHCGVIAEKVNFSEMVFAVLQHLHAVNLSGDSGELGLDFLRNGSWLSLVLSLLNAGIWRYCSKNSITFTGPVWSDQISRDNELLSIAEGLVSRVFGANQVAELLRIFSSLLNRYLRVYQKSFLSAFSSSKHSTQESSPLLLLKYTGFEKCMQDELLEKEVINPSQLESVYDLLLKLDDGLLNCRDTIRVGSMETEVFRQILDSVMTINSDKVFGSIHRNCESVYRSLIERLEVPDYSCLYELKHMEEFLRLINLKEVNNSSIHEWIVNKAIDFMDILQKDPSRAVVFRFSLWGRCFSPGDTCPGIKQKIQEKFHSMDLLFLSQWLERRLLGSMVEDSGGIACVKASSVSLRESTMDFIACLVSPFSEQRSGELQSHVFEAMLVSLDNAFLLFNAQTTKSYFSFVAQLSRGLKFLFGFLGAILSDCGLNKSTIDKSFGKSLSGNSAGMGIMASRSPSSGKNSETLVLSANQEGGSASLECNATSADEDEDDRTSDGEVGSMDKDEEDDSNSDRALASKVCTFTSSGSMDKIPRPCRFFCDRGAGGVGGSSCQCWKPRKFNASNNAPTRGSANFQSFLPFTEDGDQLPDSDSDFDEDVPMDNDNSIRLSIPREVQDAMPLILKELNVEGQVLELCSLLLPSVTCRRDSNLSKAMIGVQLQATQSFDEQRSGSTNLQRRQLRQRKDQTTNPAKKASTVSNSVRLRQRLTGSDEIQKLQLGYKVAIFDVGQLIGQATVAPVTTDKANVKPLSKNVVRFEIVHLVFNPVVENYLAVAGYEDCQVLTELVQLMVVTNRFVKIYDLSQDNISPMHYFTLPDDMIVYATLVVATQGRMFLIVLSELGCLFKLELSMKGNVSNCRSNVALAVSLGENEMFAQNLRHSVGSTLPLVGITAYKPLSKDKIHCLVLHYDGSLQIYSHVPVGVDASSAAMLEKVKSLGSALYHFVVVSLYGFLLASVIIPHDFIACDRFTVSNSNPDIVMVGFRVHVGNTSGNDIPFEITIFQRVIKLDEGMRSWYDIPFTVAESLLADEEYTILVGSTFNGSTLPRIDSLEVYGRAKDEFGWKEKMDSVLDMEACALGCNSSAAGSRKKCRITQSAPVQEQVVADGLKLLSRFYSLCRSQGYSKAAACRVLQAVFPKTDMYLQVKDTLRLLGVVKSTIILTSRLGVGCTTAGWIIEELTAQMHTVSRIALNRRSNLAAFLETNEVVDGLMQVLWGILDIEQPDTQTMNNIVISSVELIYCYAECLAMHGKDSGEISVVPAVSLLKKLLFSNEAIQTSCRYLYVLNCLFLVSAFSLSLSLSLSLAISSRLLQMPFPKQTMLGADDAVENASPILLPADVTASVGGNTQIMVEEDSITSSVQYCCDGCSTVPILRRRWHCTVCPDFDLCEACHEVLDADRLPPPHSRDHPIFAIPIEVETLGGEGNEFHLTTDDFSDSSLLPNAAEVNNQSSAPSIHMLDPNESEEFTTSVIDPVTISASKRAVNSLLISELLEQLKGWMETSYGVRAIPVMQLFYRLSSVVGGPFVDSSKPESLNLEKLVRCLVRPEKHDKAVEKEKASKISSGKDLELDGYQDVLCSYINNPHTSFVRRYVRRLFLHLCGSKTHYYSVRDSWQLLSEVKRLFKFINKSGGFQSTIPSERSVKDMNHALQKAEAGDTGTSLNKSGVQALESKKKKKEGQDGGESGLEKSYLDMEAAVDIFIAKGGDTLRQFIDCFLLEWNSSSVRSEAKCVLYGVWHHGKQSFKESLLVSLLHKVKCLPMYGQNIIEYTELVTCLSGKPDNISKQQNTEIVDRCLTPDVIRCIFETLHSQNELLVNQLISLIYNTLSGLVEFDGYYLESEPCVACSSPESVTMNVHDARRSKSVKVLNLYYNNRPMADLSELKNNWSLWKRAKSCHLAFNQTELKVDFPIPITACNFTIELDSFYTNLHALSLEPLQSSCHCTGFVINRKIALLGVLYGEKCKAAFDSVSKSVQTLQGLRQVLVNYLHQKNSDSAVASSRFVGPKTARVQARAALCAFSEGDIDAVAELNSLIQKKV
ncbi:hypothetical protein RHGRI_014362 [Rhododendron griersonianum]|uniref:Auxin transport protein BIG n=1 Tax=Rhododendron griersonianum TaxID=479676 RepID=A0AAV6K9C5_9ERIC|nr:hypothetical protein RHGRI_014362 [Rhododendron griersonianum]